jgi:hypothetical protein
MRSFDLVVAFHCCEEETFVVHSNKSREGEREREQGEEEEEDYCAMKRRHQTFVHKETSKRRFACISKVNVIISIDYGRNSRDPTRHSKDGGNIL